MQQDLSGGLEKLMNWQVLLFSLSIFILTFIIRRVVEGVWRKATGNYYWEEIVVHVMPAVLGACVAMAFKSYPYPAVIGTLGGRFFYGLGCGFFSSWAYKLLKAIIKKVTGVDVDDSAVTGDTPAKPLDVKKP